MLTILFDGIAYGMLLFVLACGLSVTLGLMNFVNLAHGAFAMAGGYVTALLMNRVGVPFLLTLPFAFVLPALRGRRPRAHALPAALRAAASRPGAVLDRARLHGRLRGGLVVGSGQQIIRLPAWLQGRARSLGVRSASTGPSSSSSAACSSSPCSSSCRAPGSAAGCGRAWTIRGSRAGSASMSAASSRSPSRSGSGLAGLGGALGAEILGLDPTFPLKIMIYVLIVVTVGGTSSITGPFLAALLLGVADVAGKYYVP